MKVAVLAHVKYPIGPPFAGGLERHTHLLVTGLCRRGHEVVLFAAAGSDPALAPVVICPPTGPHTEDPIRDAPIDAAEAEAYARMLAAVGEGGFDVVHANCLHDLPVRERGRGAAPTVVTLHVPRFEPLASALAAAPDVRVVAVSRRLAEIWRDVAPNAEVIGNGIDLAAFSAALDPAAHPYAIWSGRLSPEKGLHLAIDAARLAGIPLAFAGPRGAPAYWQNEIAPRLGDGVRDLGHLGEAELSAALRGARVAVVTPIWEEPFGLVVVEALASGTPVAGFRRGALPDLVDAESGRLAEPGDVPGLARAIVEAAALDRAACRARAEAFGVERMLDGYEALYRDMLAR